MDGRDSKNSKSERPLDRGKRPSDRSELVKAIVEAKGEQPQDNSSDQVSSEAGRGVQDKPEGERRPTILIVDDDSVLRRTLARALKQEGFSPIGTGDGQTAVEMCIRLRPAVVLLDLSMPNFNGPQVLKELKARMGDRRPPVIWITGSINPENLVHMGGAVACIGKPLKVAEIKEIVDKCLAAAAT